MYGRSKAAATSAGIGLGLTGLGILIEATTETQGPCEGYHWENADDRISGNAYQVCDGYSRNQGSTAGHVVLTSGLLTVGLGSWAYLGIPKKERPTKNYQTIEVPLDTLQRKPAGENLESAVPAIKTVVEVSSPDFMINGSTHLLSVQTNVRGDGTIQLIPSSNTFVFSLDEIANTEAASQLAEAGYRPEKYVPLLQQATVPVSYDVTIKTNATDGKNAEVTVPVKGYEIPQKSLEKVVMGL